MPIFISSLNEQVMKIEKQLFGTLPQGKDIYKYTLSNDTGMEVDVINYGAIITGSGMIFPRKGLPGTWRP